MDERTRSPLRVLAPLALAVCAVTVLVIVVSSGGTGQENGRPRAAASKSGSAQQARGSKSKQGTLSEGVYTVKAGDTLGAIAEKTGLSVERLQELNPEIDSQTLVSGEKLKLRE